MLNTLNRVTIFRGKCFVSLCSAFLGLVLYLIYKTSLSICLSLMKSTNICFDWADGDPVTLIWTTICKFYLIHLLAACTTFSPHVGSAKSSQCINDFKCTLLWVNDPQTWSSAYLELQPLKMIKKAVLFIFKNLLYHTVTSVSVAMQWMEYVHVHSAGNLVI